MAPSESARATSAAEQRFRVARPNALPRRIAVVALDAAARGALAPLAPGFPRATFHSLAPAPGLEALLEELGGRTRALVEVLREADLVLLVASLGADAAAAGLIAEAAGGRIFLAGAILGGAGAEPELLARALRGLRPHVGMLLVAEDAEDVAATLAALRA